MKRDSYAFLKPIFIWIPGVVSLFEKSKGKRDAQENQICEFLEGHITPLVDSKVTSYDSHINKKYLKVTELISPLYKEAYSLSMEIKSIQDYKVPEVTDSGQEGKRQAALIQEKMEQNKERISKIMVRLAEIKATSDMIDELIRHYEERAEGFLRTHISRYWRGVLSVSVDRLAHFPAIQHKDIDGREAYAENRTRLIKLIGVITSEDKGDEDEE